jgi:hypothetical protein
VLTLLVTPREDTLTTTRTELNSWAKAWRSRRRRKRAVTAVSNHPAIGVPPRHVVERSKISKEEKKPGAATDKKVFIREDFNQNQLGSHYTAIENATKPRAAVQVQRRVEKRRREAARRFLLSSKWLATNRKGSKIRNSFIFLIFKL